jgi:hypothetical protein
MDSKSAKALPLPVLSSILFLFLFMCDVNILLCMTIIKAEACICTEHLYDYRTAL